MNGYFTDSYQKYLYENNRQYIPTLKERAEALCEIVKEICTENRTVELPKKDNQMTEFKLCEEMGLKVDRAGNHKGFVGAYTDVILASDVEKMLQGGKRNLDFHVQRTPCESIVLDIPVKPKPVSKAEIIAALKEIRVATVDEILQAEDLVKRIEKAGIE